jgi:hypothetical protein
MIEIMIIVVLIVSVLPHCGAGMDVRAGDG